MSSWKKLKKKLEKVLLNFEEIMFITILRKGKKMLLVPRKIQLIKRNIVYSYAQWKKNDSNQGTKNKIKKLKRLKFLYDYPSLISLHN